MDIIENIISIMALDWIKNFKLCNKYFWFFARHVDLMIIKFLIGNNSSQLIYYAEA